MAKITKNILIINSMGGGGAERQVLGFYDLEEVDHIILLDNTLAYQMNLEKVIFVESSRLKNPVLKKAIQIYRAIRILSSLGANKEFHLVCFLQLSSIVGYLAARIFGCRLSISVRVNVFEMNRFSAGLYFPRWLLRVLYSRCSFIVPNSSETSHLLAKEFPNLKDRIKVVSNGYDFKALVSKSRPVELAFQNFFGGLPFLLNIGRCDEQKGQWHLLRIFAELLKKNDNVKLVILGDGKLYGELIALAKKLGLKVFDFKSDTALNMNVDVFFLGHQHNPFWFYERAKLFLLASLYEGLPNVLIEAIAFGATVVSSDCRSGPKEIMVGENADFSDHTRVPTLCDSGYLMPQFSGELIFDGRMLDAVETSWLETLKLLLNHPISFEKQKSNSLEIYNRYNIKNSRQLWKQILDKNCRI